MSRDNLQSQLNHSNQHPRSFVRSSAKTRLQFLCALAAASIFCAVSAQAITINFDEFGNGTAQSTAGSIPLPSLGNQIDPVDPTNGLTPLVYNLVAVTGVLPTPGDVDLMEPPLATGVHSDLLRFTPNGLLIVYSDQEAGVADPALADVGFPQTGFRQRPDLVLPETGPEIGPNGLFGYTPNPGDPGFLPVPPGQAVYNFLSDPAVPEPASASLFVASGISALAMRRRKKI